MGFDPSQIRVLMGLRWGSPLACSINMRGGARGVHTPTLHHVKTLATASYSRPNSKALHVRMVLAYPHVAFHPYMCGLYGGAAVIAVALIGYDDVEVATRMTTGRRWSWSTAFSTPTRDYVGSLLQLFFRCSVHQVVMVHDLLLTSILVWHGRSSATVAYPYPNSDLMTLSTKHDI
jgi:hypothetical protein